MGKWLDAFKAEVADDPFFSPDAENAKNAKNRTSVPDVVHFGNSGNFGTGEGSATCAPSLPRNHAGFDLTHSISGISGILASANKGSNAFTRDGQDRLDDFEELAARLEFQCGMSRADAERQARGEVCGPGAAVWTLAPTRRAARPLSDDEVDALLRDRRLNS